jgi:hypothetical protein
MSKPRRPRWAGVWHIWEVKCRKSAYRVLVGKPEGKRPFGRERLWWGDNIKVDREIELGHGLNLAGDRNR